MSDQHTSEASAVAEIVRAHIAPIDMAIEYGTDGSASVIAVPTGMKLQSIKPFLDEYRTAPERKKGIAKLTELDSFVGHVIRTKDEGSALFASRKDTSIQCVYDYNMPEGDPRYGEHRASYAFPNSEEWKAWTAINGKTMSMDDFARFTEDRIADLATPERMSEKSAETFALMQATPESPVAILQLSRGLSINVDRQVENRGNLQSGEGSIAFKETHSDETGKPLKVPGAFLLNLRVFEGGSVYEIAARLRYRVKNSAITWTVDLYRLDRVLDDAFRGACEMAREQTDLPLFYGAPESAVASL